VWEWCEDWYSRSEYYEACKKMGTVIDPTGPEQGALRVFRGGGWLGRAQYCRAAYRTNGGPGYRYDDLGFRLALALQSVGRPIPAFL